MAELIYPELSYDIVGVLFNVHTRLGNKYQERYYQRAVALALKKKGLEFQREIAVDLTFEGEIIGKYILDFVVENKIVLELKARPKLEKKDYKQVSAYLKANKLKLGILANFRGEKLVYKRILNSEVEL